MGLFGDLVKATWDLKGACGRPWDPKMSQKGEIIGMQLSKERICAKLSRYYSKNRVCHKLAPQAPLECVWDVLELPLGLTGVFLGESEGALGSLGAPRGDVECRGVI